MSVELILIKMTTLHLIFSINQVLLKKKANSVADE